MTQTRHDRGDWAPEHLTERQRQVIELLAKGYTNAQVGDALGISLDGAKWHVSEIIARLGVSSREEAVEHWRAYKAPSARLSRAVRGVAAWPSLRLVATASAIAGVAALGVASVAILLALGDEPEPVVVASPTQQGPTRPTPTPTVVAGAGAFTNKDGFIEIIDWDDRQLPQEEKDAAPWVDPRWAPFNRCMVELGRGIPEKAAPGSVVYYDDIRAIVERVNREGPFMERTDTGQRTIHTPALDDFLRCAYPLLTLPPDEAPLEPGDPTGHEPVAPNPDQ